MTDENDESLKRFLESKALISGIVEPLESNRIPEKRKGPLKIEDLIPYRSLKVDTTLTLGLTALAMIAIQEAGENRKIAFEVYKALREYDYPTARGYLRDIKQGTQDVSISALYVIKKTLEKLFTQLKNENSPSEV